MENEALKVARNLTNQVFGFIKSCSDEELRALESGQAFLRLEYTTTSRDGASKKGKITPLIGAGFSEIISALGRAETIEEGHSVLDGLDMTRREIEALAREMDVPSRKGESADKIKSRIVEFAVGARLNSKAIRGN